MSFLSTPTLVLSDRSNHSIGKLASIPMTMNTALFSYEELQGPCAFRLLDLLPGQRVDPICCTIKHASVASRPEFYALSYCWGAASDREHIWIDGKLLAIQRNLHEFLIELRLLDRPRTIWADAICINQGDIAERTTQIALMRDIYSAAQTVMVWLGPHDAGSPQLFESFELIAADPASVQTSGSRDWKADIVQAFEELMSRPYWRRTWIIQEIVLANNIRLFCGNASTPWLDFVAIYMTWFQEATPAYQPRYPWPTKKSRRKYYRVEALDMLVDLRKRDAQPLLLDMMDWNHPFECFDFRDRVYGVLGFVADGADFLPLVDYHCSAEDLFLSVLEKLKVHTDRSLYNFITRLQTLATRIGLDLVECTEFLKILKRTEPEVLTSFDANAGAHLLGRDVNTIMYTPHESESEVQLRRTSLTLRKYYNFSVGPIGHNSDVITKAELLPGDWLSFLHPGVH